MHRVPERLVAKRVGDIQGQCERELAGSAEVLESAGRVNRECRGRCSQEDIACIDIHLQY